MLVRSSSASCPSSWATPRASIERRAPSRAGRQPHRRRDRRPATAPGPRSPARGQLGIEVVGADQRHRPLAEQRLGGLQHERRGRAPAELVEVAASLARSELLQLLLGADQHERGELRAWAAPRPHRGRHR